MKNYSEHIKYSKSYRYSLFDAFIKAIKETAIKKNKPLECLKVFDVGCGRGEFLEYSIKEGIKMIEGIDFDPICVKMSKKYAKCYLGNINDAQLLLKNKNFDLILMSHSLEHMRDPQAILEKLSLFTDYFLLAVPNPLRPNVTYFALKKYNYSNLGHYYCWDRSHFTVFLEKRCDMIIDNWYIDAVRLPCKIIRAVLSKLKIINYFERILLPKLFPYFSTSLIVLCHKP